MKGIAPDLWSLTRGRPQIDPNDLAEAVARQADEAELDYRTRLLIRDSLDALRQFWGDERLQNWLRQCPQRQRIESIHAQDFDKIGFPSITRRLMDKTKPELIRQFLEHLGRRIARRTRLFVAGSVALILPGYLHRHTEDIDVVDELPKELRENHALLKELQDSYGLQLGHVRSHYFPSGWQDRVHSLSDFGNLQIFLLDVYDVFLSKLFSVRTKDMGDLRELLPQLDKTILTERFSTTCRYFLAALRLQQIAQDNWQILFGEPLPT